MILTITTSAMVAIHDYMAEVVGDYYSIDNKKENSKENFDKQLAYVYVNANGDKVLSYGFGDEVAIEELNNTLGDLAEGYYEVDINGTLTPVTPSTPSLPSNVACEDTARPMLGMTSSPSITASSLAQSASTFYKTVTEDWGDVTAHCAYTAGSSYFYVTPPYPYESGKVKMLDRDNMNVYLNEHIGRNCVSAIATNSYLSAANITSAGVSAVGASLPPILAMIDIDANGNNVQSWSTSGTTFSDKICAVFKNSSGECLYLPVTDGNDRKGHTWPGGLCQTFLAYPVQFRSDGSLLFKHSNNTDNTGLAIGNPGTSSRLDSSSSDLLMNKSYSFSSLKTAYSSTGLYYAAGSPLSWGLCKPQMNLEVKNSTISNAIGTVTSAGYSFYTFMVWE